MGICRESPATGTGNPAVRPPITPQNLKFTGDRIAHGDILVGTMATGKPMTGTMQRHRRSIRLKGYDYTGPGAYFVTVCTHERIPLFGRVVDGETVLNEYGKIVREEWLRTARVRPNVELFANEFVVMPNHIHGIIWIMKTDDVGANRRFALPMAIRVVRHRVRWAPSLDNSNPSSPNALTSAATPPAHPSGNAIITNTSSATNAPYTPSAATLPKTRCAGTRTVTTPVQPNKKWPIFPIFARRMRSIRNILWAAIVLAAPGLNAQITVIIPPHPSHVLAGEGDTIPVVITNSGGSPAFVYGIATPFEGMDALPYRGILGVGVSDTLRLIRRPGHNITYRFPVWVMSDRGIASVIHAYQGVYADSSYYKGTRNLWDDALKQKLKQIISANYVTLGYSTARDKMFMVIDNWRVNGRGSSVNKVECVYTGRTIQGYSSRYDAQNQGFNTEHTFPQSKFGGGEPMRSDLFHLFPTDAAANSARSNLPFGEVTTPTWSSGGSKKDYNKFEPRDAQKGPAARALFYFVVRYQDYSGFVAPQESTLRNWHNVFPPNAVEKRRNQDIYAVQHNRNPFIDHPEFVDRIYSITGSATRPVQPALTIPADTIVIAANIDTFEIPFWVRNGTVHIAGIDYDTAAMWILGPLTPTGHEQEGRLRVGLRPTADTGTYPVTLHWGSNRTTHFYVRFTSGNATAIRPHPARTSCDGLRFRKNGIMIERPVAKIRICTVKGRQLRQYSHPRTGHLLRYPSSSSMLIVRWREGNRICTERTIPYR